MRPRSRDHSRRGPAGYPPQSQLHVDRSHPPPRPRSRDRSRPVRCHSTAALRGPAENVLPLGNRDPSGSGPCHRVPGTPRVLCFRARINPCTPFAQGLCVSGERSTGAGLRSPGHRLPGPDRVLIGQRPPPQGRASGRGSGCCPRSTAESPRAFAAPDWVRSLISYDFGTVVRREVVGKASAMGGGGSRVP